MGFSRCLRGLMGAMVVVVAIAEERRCFVRSRSSCRERIERQSCSIVLR
jgi:hypothetical protein